MAVCSRPCARPICAARRAVFRSSPRAIERATYESGSRYPLRRVQDGFAGEIEGPADTFLESSPTLRIPFRVTRRGSAFELEIHGRRGPLNPGEYTGWISGWRFRTALGATASGMARFLLTETEPECASI